MDVYGPTGQYRLWVGVPCGDDTVALRTIALQRSSFTILTEPSFATFSTVEPTAPVWVPAADTAVQCFLEHSAWSVEAHQCLYTGRATEISVQGSIRAQSPAPLLEAMVETTLICGALAALERAAPKDVVGARLLRLSQLPHHLIGLIWSRCIFPFRWSAPDTFELREDRLTFNPSRFVQYESGTMSRNVLYVSQIADGDAVHGSLLIETETIDVAAVIKAQDDALITAADKFRQAAQERSRCAIQ